MRTFDFNLFLTSLADKCNSIPEKENEKRIVNSELRAVFEMIASEVELTDEVLDFMKEDVLTEILDILEAESCSEVCYDSTVKDMVFITKTKEVVKGIKTKIIPDTTLLF